ncbi:hypothetical protein [Streptomyces sp. x-19]
MKGTAFGGGSSGSRVYWAMTHVIARRLTDTSTLTCRDPLVAGA